MGETVGADPKEDVSIIFVELLVGYCYWGGAASTQRRGWVDDIFGAFPMECEVIEVNDSVNNNTRGRINQNMIRLMVPSSALQ